MDLKELFTEDRGVSPVIGVILMVAITVILAAVIGAFVLGLGDQASNTAPQVAFDFDFGDEDVTVTHSGGDTVDNSSLTVRNATPETRVYFGGETVSSGDSAEIDHNEEGEVIRVVWTSDDGDTSNTLAQRSAP